MRRESISAAGFPTRWMALEFSSGRLAVSTSVTGLLTTKTAWASYHLREVTSIQASSNLTSAKVTATTNGQITENLRDGGTKINNMALAFTSARSRPRPSSAYGRWGSEYDGSQNKSVSRFVTAS